MVAIINFQGDYRWNVTSLINDVDIADLDPFQYLLARLFPCSSALKYYVGGGGRVASTYSRMGRQDGSWLRARAKES